MKCPSCGAEVGNSKFCEFCGTQISSDMLREQERLNKQGCPKCGSTNIQFKRENQGEVRGKKSKQVIHRTVGFCKDCGHTWFSDDGAQTKKRKTWLWVLGWIFIFPVPLTILMVRNKSMKPVLKYGIIAVGWIVYLLIALSGTGSDKSETPAPAELPTATVALTKTPKPTLSPTATPEPTETPDVNASLDSYIAIWEILLKENYGDNFRIDRDENFVTINVWGDGITAEATAAKLGNQDYLASWDGMVENTVDAQKTYQKSLRDAGISDAIVIINVLNDLNLDNILLCVSAGTVMYDDVNGINLIG